MSELIARREMMMKTRGHNLPPEYQEVEWIKNTTGAFIDITFPSVPTYSKFGILLKSIVHSRGFALFSKNSNNLFHSRHYEKTTNATVISGVSEGGGLTWNIEQLETTSLSTEGIYKLGKFYPLQRSIKTQINTLTLFLCTAGNNNYYSLDSLFYGEIFSDNIIVKIIPCYRKSDNIIGVYDPIQELFFAGTGTFSVGPDV